MLERRNPELIFLELIDRIEPILGYLSKRHSMCADEADDFRADAYMHLIDNDYAVIQAWREESSIETYLTTVLTRLFLDHRNKTCGRWKPSAAAVRLGETAILLEKFMVRDRHNFHATAEILRSHHGVTLDDRALVDLAQQLPIRNTRCFEMLGEMADQRPDAEDSMIRGQAEQGKAFLTAALTKELAALPQDEHRLVTLRFYDSLSVAGIARKLGEDQKRLYYRISCIVNKLRKALLQQGFFLRDIAWILAEA